MQQQLSSSYSVLMSVYAREKPEYLAAAMDSMFGQTVPPGDFVLVCDGPLNEKLNQVIREQKKRHRGILHVVRLRKNGGLGRALRTGTNLCRYELVARMDSDDISLPDRCEKELDLFRKYSDLHICSGAAAEFRDRPEKITGVRVLPLSAEEIARFSRKRNPFNHPAVMFRKSAVLRAGGYNERFHYFEDYYLWVRMLMRGSRGRNLRDPLVYMRSSEDMYRRRGGWPYARELLKFHSWLLASGWSTPMDFLTGAIPHAAVSIAPNWFRMAVYRVLHRKKLNK